MDHELCINHISCNKNLPINISYTNNISANRSTLCSYIMQMKETPEKTQRIGLSQLI